MKEIANIHMEELEQAYASSKALMSEATANHQEVTDFCYALRFLLRLNPGGDIFVNGIEKLLVHMESLRLIAASYHTAVGKVVKDQP